MAQLLVVIGATGTQGSAVVDHFLKNEPDFKIRGLTRKPLSDAAVALANRGVEIAQADMEDTESLKAAFAGADVIFAYTDFGTAVGSPEAMAMFQSGHATALGAAAAMIEYRQGKNVADVAATVSGLKRLIWSTLPDVSKWSKGKYVKVAHFDGKAAVFEYMKATKGLEGKVSGLQMGTFADDVVRLPNAFPMKKQPDGSYVLSMPLSGKAPMPFIWVERDAGAYVSALIKAPSGIEVLASSEYLNMEQWLDLWAAHHGVRAVYECAHARSLLHEDTVGMKRHILEVFQFIDEYGYDGGDPGCFSADELERKFEVHVPRSKITDHIKVQDWSAVL